MDRIEVPDSQPMIHDLPPQTFIYVLLGIVVLIVLVSAIQFSRNRAQLRRDWHAADVARTRQAPGLASSSEFFISGNITFKAKSILSMPSLEVLGVIEDVVWEINGSFSVLLGCPLEGFLDPEAAATNPQIDHALETEVIDYLVINGAGLPVLAVMFYKDGPTGNSRSAGDQSSNTLRSILNQTGIRFFEVEPGFRARDVAKRLRKTLNSAIL